MIDLYRDVALGWPGLIEAAPFAARIVVGGMFFLSGFYKLFSTQNAEKRGKPRTIGAAKRSLAEARKALQAALTEQDSKRTVDGIIGGLRG